MKLKTFALPSPLSGLYTPPHGWGNGYVVIPKDHPLNGLDYDTIHDKYDIDVHGGLTFSASAKELKEENWLPNNIEVKDGDWIIGFDTGHYGDSLSRWPSEESVIDEANRLAEQIELI